MAEVLSPTQSAALLDILSHVDTYSEIRDFRYPGALRHYGPPFTTETGRPSTSPALQALLSKFALTLPGLRDVPDDFWTVQVHELIESFEDGNLSESYDKGAMGSRKTLATAVSALIEYPVRGVYGGFAEVKSSKRAYDLHSAEDLGRAFRDFMDQCIYGNIIDDLVAKAAQTDDLEQHDSLIKAFHEFILVNLASFMHYTLVLSPKGQYLLKLIDNANKLIPYLVIRQTLKIGNVASMISAMMKVILAKMSVTSITNWIGLTANQDDGVNLMQQIISTVLHWDIRDLQSRVGKLEKDKECPSKSQLDALKSYTLKTRDEQDQIRKDSQYSSNSIVITILAYAGEPSDLSEHSHKLALDYLNCKLSIRDREVITKVLCHSRPDHLTTLVRSLVDAYEPIIRHMHNAVDLSDTVGDFQNFITDMLKVARVQPPSKDGKTTVPTVGDFVQLLRKHQYSSHKFIHQLCKNGNEVTQWYVEWVKQAACQFRSHTSSSEKHAADNNSEKHHAAGDMTQPLSEIFADLPKDKQQQIISVLDATSAYLKAMHTSSTARLSEVLQSTLTTKPQSSIQKIISHKPLSRPSSRPSSRAASPTRPTRTGTNLSHHTSVHSTHSTHQHDVEDTDKISDPPKVSNTQPGPGSFLSRWQNLLGATPITPLAAHGTPVRASDDVVVSRSTVDVDGSKMVELDGGEARKVKPAAEEGGKMKMPDFKVVVEALGEPFRELLAKSGCYW